MTETQIDITHQSKLKPDDNKFHKGNGSDGKHYWITPPDLYKQLDTEFKFDFDPCPFPKPENFDGLTCEWGKSSYVNPPFGSIMHQGLNDKKPKKKGATAWVRKAIEEHKKGKNVVFVHPMDKWVLMMIEAGAKITNLGDVKWLATEDGSAGKGTGRHIACFALTHNNGPSPREVKLLEALREIDNLLDTEPRVERIENYVLRLKAAIRSIIIEHGEDKWPDLIY